MKSLRFFLCQSAALALLLAPGAAPAKGRAPTFDPGKLQELNQLLEDSTKRGDVPGAVVWLDVKGQGWGNHYGSRALDPSVQPMEDSTIFDAASLTKVLVTAPSIHLLIQDGKLGIDQPASAWLPEFTGGGREQITLRQMLTHVSGLRSGLGPGPAWEGYQAGVARALAEPLVAAPGQEFRYSDLNFILLGEIVRRVSGESLQQFSQRRLFRPLAMADTGYLPSARQRQRIAPTAREGAAVIHGVVHDPTARRMGGIAGHAGLFTTARDIGRFARMLLDGGKAPSGQVVLRPATVRALTAVLPPLPGGIRRTLGFDAASAFSDPKGAHFGPKSFGHTGWTGCCFWIDPEADACFVLMTNRNHPSENHSVKELRYHSATLAAEAMGAAKRVWSGADRLAASGWKSLEGKKVGLVTNQTGRTSAGATTLSALQAIPGVEVVRLFSPEHGIAGKLDREGIADSTDPASGLPVISLYGQNRKPTAATLADLQVLVFDIQDIGTRFYTYIATLLNCMEAAAAAHLPLVVLDRVNPLGGLAVEGPLPLAVDNAFVACHSLPVRHGLTIGEMARLLARERTPAVSLAVLPLEGWQRAFAFRDTLAPWVDPSPNMRSPEAALLYPGLGLLEFTNVSVGRGTVEPFNVLGAPWIDPAALARRLRQVGIPGVRFEETMFTPNASVFAGQRCRGLRFAVTDPRELHPVRLGIAIAQALYQEHGEQFQLAAVNQLLFHPPTLQAIRDRRPLAQITADWAPDEAAFRRRCQPLLLYPPLPSP